ncbi:hypothetical protein MTO96_031304 [Rhipicephalus appendiculatus]
MRKRFCGAHRKSLQGSVLSSPSLAISFRHRHGEMSYQRNPRRAFDLGLMVPIGLRDKGGAAWRATADADSGSCVTTEACALANFASNIKNDAPASEKQKKGGTPLKRVVMAASPAGRRFAYLPETLSTVLRNACLQEISRRAITSLWKGKQSAPFVDTANAGEATLFERRLSTEVVYIALFRTVSPAGCQFR